MSFPDFTDLRQIALALKDDAQFDDLRRSIESVWRVQSCNADLRQSADACEALNSLRRSPRQQGSLSRATTENALLITGVMLYARATGTSGQRGERGSIQLDAKKLAPQEHVDHTILLDIRNRAFAHVYRESPIADNVWHEDVVFAVDFAERGWRPAVGSNRISFHVPTFERLQRQIPVADAHLMKAFHKRIDAVTHMINVASVPLDLFLRFRFDPVQKFGGVKAAEQILAGTQVGHATVMTDRP
ncbi:hypothetical protein [Sphingobium sp. KCTC 72723]|uniref:hypothetical protein n=1 Tax=Sphingobium sp. KCTC 72723 TaxID=2733867 RepID=UPI00165DE7C3|nr:hypothetical protein [Sphingobium sp. KCTC 72723]